MAKIKNLIFDFGAVMTKGRFKYSLARVISRNHKISYKDALEKTADPCSIMDFGKFDDKVIIRKVCRDLGITLADFKRCIKEALNINKEMVKLIKQLKKRYRILMLSDNDDIIFSIIKKEYSEVYNLFEKPVSSHVAKLKKPDPDIYRYLFKKTGSKATECVFVDDKLKNIYAAELLGVKGVVFDSAKQLKKELIKLGVYNGN